MGDKTADDTPDAGERRLRARIRGAVRVNVQDGRENVLVQSMDLSSSGMRFGTDREMPLFREMSLAFKLPSADNREDSLFHCHAVVVSCNKRSHGDGFHVALTFLEVSPEDRTLLNHFLELARTQNFRLT